MGFLNEERKTALVEKLCALSMPESLAGWFASWPDDHATLDAQLTAAVENCIKWCQDYTDLEEDAPPEAATALVQFTLADLVIMDVYSDEIKERGLNGPENFPVFNKAIRENMAKLDGMAAALSGNHRVQKIDFDVLAKAAEVGLRMPQAKQTLH